MSGSHTELCAKISFIYTARDQLDARKHKHERTANSYKTMDFQSIEIEIVAANTGVPM